MLSQGSWSLKNLEVRQDYFIKQGASEGASKGASNRVLVFGGTGGFGADKRPGNTYITAPVTRILAPR